MPPVRISSDHFSPDISDFIRLLHLHGVRYLIVGGEAVILHGHSRLTGDVDFFFRGDAENAGRLYTVLEEFWDGDVPGLEGGAELSEEGLIVQFGQPPNRIDLINSIEGVAFDDAWAGRVEAVLEGADTPVPYIGLTELAENKRAAGRPKDLDDLEFLTKRP